MQGGPVQVRGHFSFPSLLPEARAGPVKTAGGLCHSESMLRKILLALLVIVFSAYVVSWAMGAKRPDHPYYTDFLGPGPWVHAHGGGQHLWPDNTMTSFSGAAALGVDVLELDTQITSDGHIVVIHDSTVDRTTNGTGRVDSFTLEQLQELDAAFHWRGPDGDFPYRGAGLTVPTLREVLEAFPAVGVNIDMKSDDPRVPEATCRLIRETGREHSVMVASFVQRNLHEFRELCPEAATSAGPDEVRDFLIMNLLGLGRATSPAADAFQVPVRQGRIPVVTSVFVRGLKERNVVLDVWTINDEAEMRRLYDMGVQGIITDRPDLALQILGR